MTMTETCAHPDCSEKALTMLEVDGEETPSCEQHLQHFAEQTGEENEQPGRYPVLSNGEEDQAAWINTDKNGEAYLSVKTGDGEYINLFPRSDHLQICLNQIHEQQKKDRGGEE